jgi:DNA-binding NtrC family response regulator
MTDIPLKVLAVDDNTDALYVLEQALLEYGFAVITASSGREAIERAQREQPALILLDINMPGMDGYEVTTALKAAPETAALSIILLTALNTLEDVARGLDLGATDYMTKPFRAEELALRLHVVGRHRRIETEVHDLRNQLRAQKNFGNIIGKSPAMQNLFSVLEKVKDANVPVLIMGESGTGKELIARAIHYNSPRRDMPFVVQNCSAFNDNLLESELFGHVKGSFTGAIRDKEGLFAAADGGTFFLDELGEMSPALQVKLLRVIQQGTFLPVGGTKERKVDVRIVTATHRDIPAMVTAGAFREDLYYRLNLVTLRLPPLRERTEDIPLIIDHILERERLRQKAAPRTLAPETLKRLLNYPWPGNIRELENEIERLLLMSGNDAVLSPEALSPHVFAGERGDKKLRPPSGTLKEATEALERAMITAALERTGGNKSEAARELGIARSNLITKANAYGLGEGAKEKKSPSERVTK